MDSPQEPDSRRPIERRIRRCVLAYDASTSGHPGLVRDSSDESEQRRLGAALKHHFPSRYIAGIERDPGAAEAARCELDAVYAIDLARDGLPPEAGRFDAILFCDVLEHLDDPWRTDR
jgi:hypothetical protein